MKKDFYAVLQVSRDASPEQITRAYRAIALEHHPDRAGDSQESLTMFREATAAYNTLIDPVKRRKYDRTFEPVRSLAELLSHTPAGRNLLEVMLPKAPAAPQRGLDSLMVVHVPSTLLKEGGPVTIRTEQTELFVLQVPPGDGMELQRICRISRHGKSGKNQADSGDLWVVLVGEEV